MCQNSSTASTTSKSMARKRWNSASRRRRSAKTLRTFCRDFFEWRISAILIPHGVVRPLGRQTCGSDHRRTRGYKTRRTPRERNAKTGRSNQSIVEVFLNFELNLSLRVRLFPPEGGMDATVPICFGNPHTNKILALDFGESSVDGERQWCHFLACRILPFSPMSCRQRPTAGTATW